MVQPGAPAPAPASPVIQQQDKAHSILGRAVRSLFGTRTDYRVDDKGNTVAVPVAEKPGELFRHIVAGAILGGAIGSHDKSFAQGAASGAGAVQQREDQQDQQRRAAAQQDYRNRIEAEQQQREKDKAQREADAAGDEERLRKAQIAHFNALTAQENQMVQGTNFTQHQATAQAGKTQIEPYLAAGIKPLFNDIPESEMHDIISKNPGASTYLWEPTGTKVSLDAKGQPQYELTYSAVDPKGQVAVTPGLLKLFKEVDMEKYYPGMSDYLKPGKTMSATDMIVLQHE